MAVTSPVDRAPLVTRIPPPFDRRTLEHPYFEPGPRHVGYLLVASFVLLPMLVPSGPGNTGLADLGIIAAVIGIFVWLRAQHLVVTMPYLLPMGLLMVSGAVAAYVASAEGSALPSCRTCSSCSGGRPSPTRCDTAGGSSTWCCAPGCGPASPGPR